MYPIRKVTKNSLGAQMEFVTEAMLCKVFRHGDGKPSSVSTVVNERGEGTFVAFKQIFYF